MGLSSTNRIVWRYFAALRRLVIATESAEDDTTSEQVALCLMLAVTVVETFVNVLFRVMVSEPDFIQHKGRIDSDLSRRRTIDYKLKQWPTALFGRPIDAEEPALKAFLALKERRNALMHFTSSHESIIANAITIDGLSDTSALDELTTADAAKAIETAEEMVGLLLRLRGIPKDRLPHALHLWTGRPPKTL